MKSVPQMEEKIKLINEVVHLKIQVKSWKARYLKASKENLKMKENAVSQQLKIEKLEKELKSIDA